MQEGRAAVRLSTSEAGDEALLQRHTTSGARMKIVVEKSRRSLCTRRRIVRARQQTGRSEGYCVLVTVLLREMISLMASGCENEPSLALLNNTLLSRSEMRKHTVVVGLKLILYQKANACILPDPSTLSQNLRHSSPMPRNRVPH